MENLDSIDKQTLQYLKQDYEEIKKDQSTNTENKENKNNTILKKRRMESNSKIQYRYYGWY